jgi:hypothetical protein
MTMIRLAGMSLALSMHLSAQEVKVATAHLQDPRLVCDALAHKYRDAVATYQRQREEMIAAGKRPPKPRDVLKPMTERVVAEIHGHAQHHAGKEAAVPFLILLVEVGGDAATKFSLNDTQREMVQAALDGLAGSHRTSPLMGDVIRESLYFVGPTYDREKIVKQWVDWVAEEHPEPKCRAQALLTRGLHLVRMRQADGALRDFRMLLKVTTDADLLAKARQEIGYLEKFAVGSVAPEIEGVDMDSVAFRLADYRGKVVLLDFWGFW